MDHPNIIGRKNPLSAYVYMVKANGMPQKMKKPVNS